MAGVGLVWLALTWTTAAAADPSESAKETARGLMAEGRELRDKRDLSGALARFQAADALMGVPTTGFEIARTQTDMGLLIEARATLRRVLAITERPDDPEPFKLARDKAKALDAELGQRIGAVRVRVRGAAQNEVSVTVDQDQIPSAALELPFRVNPGRHRVLVRSGGKEQLREIEVPERETIAVSFELGAAARAPRANAVPASAPPDSARGKVPTLTYVGGGLGVAGLVVGGVSGVVALSKKQAAQRGCVANRCPPATWDDLDAARSFATASTFGFLIAGLGIGVGAGAWWLREPESAPSTAAWQVVASPSGVRVGGRF
jgi:hypothetical protein